MLTISPYDFSLGATVPSVVLTTKKMAQLRAALYRHCANESRADVVGVYGAFNGLTALLTLDHYFSRTIKNQNRSTICKIEFLITKHPGPEFLEEFCRVSFKKVHNFTNCSISMVEVNLHHMVCMVYCQLPGLTTRLCLLATYEIS